MAAAASTQSIESGYSLHDTAYGQGVSIKDTEGLHRAIAEWLIALPRPLDGAELRFLRLEMDLAPRELSDLLGAAEHTLRLWEKRRAKPLSGSTDRLLRALYAESAMGLKMTLRRFIERLGSARASERGGGRFRWTQTDWKIESGDKAAA